VERELAWLLAPICALLWQLGGYRWKTLRREGVPLSILSFGLIFSGFSWGLLLSALLLWCVIRLPFTLVGDSLHDFWGNWAWIWVLGALYGLPSLVLRLDPLAVLAPLLTVGLLGTSSNLPRLSRFAPWKLVEGAIGFSVAYPYCLVFSS
jgi:hypothetical protein